MPLSLTHGLLVGLAQLFATLIVFAFGLHSSAEGLARAQMPESLVGFILLMLILGLAHRSAKTRALASGGDFGFGSAAKFFALIAVVGGVFTGLGQWFYLSAVNPGLREIQRAKIMETAAPELSKLPPEQAAQITQTIDLTTSAVARGVVYGVNTFLFALLLGLAYALIFRAAARRDEAARSTRA